MVNQPTNNPPARGSIRQNTGQTVRAKSSVPPRLTQTAVTIKRKPTMLNPTAGMRRLAGDGLKAETAETAENVTGLDTSGFAKSIDFKWLTDVTIEWEPQTHLGDKATLYISPTRATSGSDLYQWLLPSYGGSGTFHGMVLGLHLNKRFSVQIAVGGDFADGGNLGRMPGFFYRQWDSNLNDSSGDTGQWSHWFHMPWQPWSEWGLVTIPNSQLDAGTLQGATLLDVAPSGMFGSITFRAKDGDGVEHSHEVNISRGSIQSWNVGA